MKCHFLTRSGTIRPQWIPNSHSHFPNSILQNSHPMITNAHWFLHDPQTMEAKFSLIYFPIIFYSSCDVSQLFRNIISKWTCLTGWQLFVHFWTKKGHGQNIFTALKIRREAMHKAEMSPILFSEQILIQLMWGQVGPRI